jgi:hypothetical protein
MLEVKDWDILLKRIKNGKCTPFLGSGACSKKISIISQIANEWAKEYDYPMEDSDDLIRVELVTVVEDLMTLRKKIYAEKSKNCLPQN